ncbi:patatin-like phospholipase family protein [Salicola sp. Rm-C-2C1-2]|uniref:patatin-like phospholipase family protein n=1 Tax=Salicola sp. Rm-C-2C1-2 TaxID=3141321 RepID=UPI0032E383D4
MARFEFPLTNREPTFGLALGGGAVFGIAHLGALKALEEHGLRPTHITGTSIGAIMASLYAFGHTPEAIRDACSELEWWQVSSFGWSRYGIMNNSAMGDFVRSHIGERDFSEAPCPMAFIATDLASRTRVVLDSGDVAEAAMTSACVPGLYSPIERGEQLLVDGGLVENVPISPLRARGVDFVMGIDLNGSRRPRQPGGIFDALITAFDIAIDSHTRTQLAEADFVLSLDLADYDRTDPDQSDALFREGYDACQNAIPRIRQTLDAKAPGLLQQIRRRLSRLRSSQAGSKGA